MKDLKQHCAVLVMPRLTEMPPASLLSAVNEAARQRAATFLNHGRACDFLWARVLLLELARRYGLEAYFEEHPPRSPVVLVEGKTLYCSISHTSTYVAAALAPVAVGIDIEVMNPRRSLKAISEKVFSEGVYESVPEVQRVLHFYKNWGIHESAVKMPAQLSVENLEVRAWGAGGEPTYPRFWPLEKETLLTVLLSEALECEMTLVTAEELF